MTEAEWLGCTDPMPMLEFLKGKTSDRKLRLFGVACCRKVWHLVRDARHREAVEVGEGFADGLLSEEERQVAHNRITNIEYPSQPQNYPGRSGSHAAAWYVSGGNPWYAACDGSRHAAEAIADEELGKFNWWQKAYELECAGVESNEAVQSARAEMVAREETGRNRARKCHTDLLRCIVGPLPFRLVALNPSWLTPTHKTALAQAIYDDRAFDRMPQLADALEQAGCSCADILAHCRGPGPHVRGCWVVDLILGKE